HSNLKNISEIFAYISGVGLVQQLDKAQASLRLSLFVRWLLRSGRESEWSKVNKETSLVILYKYIQLPSLNVRSAALLFGNGVGRLLNNQKFNTLP
ncbi:hypothetical protein L2734_18240, partial [Parashewanella spongiae]